jgi:signal transduction histidine kinase
MGEFFDEGGGGAFAEGQAVPPQLGYVVMAFGAMISAAVAIVAIARLGLFPTWLTRSSFVVAALLAVTSAMVVTMVLLPIWVATATLTLRRSRVENAG